LAVAQSGCAELAGAGPLPGVQAAEEGKVCLLQTPAVEAQRTANWCWAAVIQNVLAAYDVRVSQEQVVMATYGRVVDLPLFDARQAVMNLFSANSLVAPRGRVVHPFLVSGAPFAPVLVREIEREKSPVVAIYRQFGGSQHAVVCYGVQYTGTPEQPTVVRVFVKDPADGQEKTWTGAELAGAWTATIFLRVAPRPPERFVYLGQPYVVTPTYEVVSPLRGQIEGRVWYCNEQRHWHALRMDGTSVGTID